MSTKNLKVRLGLPAVVLIVVGLTGCNSEPAAPPIDQRKPGQDISPQERASKRGDVPTPGATTPGGK